MATNRVLANGRDLKVICTLPVTPAAGDPCIVGNIPGVALGIEDADGYAVIDTKGVYALSCKGVTTGAAGSAIEPGDIIYYTSGHTPVLDKYLLSGVRFGYALEHVDSGATKTINVKIGY
jgi:hypothetical protein